MAPATERDGGASFAARVRAACQATRTHLCLGLDPSLEGMPAWFRSQWEARGPQAFLETWACTLIDAAAGVAPAVKPQAAYFEAHGAAGFAALERTMAYARERGLLTVLDGKRGDIASTMAAYGTMAFDVMGADALTVTPYMGLDVIEPLVPWLERGRGVYTVWVTSNPSGVAVQELAVDAGGGVTTLAGHMLSLLRRGFRDSGITPSLGLVLGATKLDRVPRELSAALPEVSLLMPGIGAQGGTVTQELRALMSGAASCLVPQSRSLASWSDVTSATGWDALGQAVRRRVVAAAAALPV
jgi:orotidine-5'-phosphate decarboxylase